MSNVVRDYYNDNFEREWRRLEDPYARIEFFSTLYMIKKYFPERGRVLDIGAGPGRYSIELLKRGYNVSLLEISDKELELAKNNIESFGLKADQYLCMDVRELECEDCETYDAILLMGPMYHVHSKDDRASILNTCRNLLKPGGIVLISYINSWGTLKAGVSEFPEAFEDIDELYNYFDEIKLSHYEGFTECYFTTPPIALEEVKESGLEVVSYAGAESFLSGFGNSMTAHYLENRKIYLNLLKVAAEKCEEYQFRDATEHLIVVAKK